MSRSHRIAADGVVYLFVLNMTGIRLERVSRHFGRVAAVDDVSLEIRDREVVTVVGPSGCGKSTLLRMIAGLDRPTSGTVWIGGQPVNDVPARLRNMAMVFQSKKTREICFRTGAASFCAIGRTCGPS